MWVRKDFPSLYDLAERQGGVVTKQQAVSHGDRYETQKLRIDNGVWKERFGCLVLTNPPLGQDWIDASALTLRYGREAIITGPIALRIARIPITNPLVLVAGKTPNTPVPGVRLLRDTSSRLFGHSQHFTYALAADAITDTLLHVDESTSKQLLDTALQRHWLTINRLSEVLERRRAVGRSGIAKLERLLRWSQAGTRSEAERRAWPLLQKAARIRWVANYPITIDGHIVAEADFAAPGLRLCIEIDGRAYHSDDRSFENDRARQNLLVLAGWTVLRFTWKQITEQPHEVIRQVREAISRLCP